MHSRRVLLVFVSMLTLVSQRGLADQSIAAGPNDARQTMLRSLKNAMTALSEHQRGTITIDRSEVVRLAAQMQTVARSFPNYFEVADQAGASRASADIWHDKPGWTAAVSDFQSATDQLAAVAPNGDAAQTVRGIRTVAQSCRQCHDHFRLR